MTPQRGDRVRKRGRSFEGFVTQVLPTGTITIGVTWDRANTRPVSFYAPEELEVIG